MRGRCSLCLSTERRGVAVRQDGLPIQECLSCGLAYVDPRPSSEQLNSYYNKGYFSGGKDFFRGKDYCLERDKAISRRDVTGYREVVSHFEMKGKAVLDIGCASGALLCLLRDHGAEEVVGIDTVEYPVSFGRAQYELDLRCTTLEEASLPDAQFDLITMIDLLEHLEDLNSALTQIRRILKPAGSVFIITPNYEAHVLARQKWVCLHQDFEHLHYFSEQSLRRICMQMGFSLRKSWTDSIPFRIVNYPAIRKHNLHRILHPWVALNNAYSRANHVLSSRMHRNAGSTLHAILSPV